MSGRVPPRYLPTLTEVVRPETLGDYASTPSGPVLPAAPQRAASHTPAPPNRQLLAQQVMEQVRPRLEAELRNIAQELFEAQFSALLPSLHLQIEEAVREAIDQALPDLPPDL